MRIEEKTSKLGKCADKKLRLKDQRSDHVGTITSLTKPSFQMWSNCHSEHSSAKSIPEAQNSIILARGSRGEKEEWMA